MFQIDAGEDVPLPVRLPRNPAKREKENMCESNIDSTQRNKKATDLVKPPCLSKCIAMIADALQLVVI